MAFADGSTRRIVQGFMPVKITLAGTVARGDPLGYSSGWKVADANAGIPAVLIAGDGGVSGDVITAYPAALVDGVTGATAGNDIYLSDTGGDYTETKSTTSEQKLGFALSATEMFIWLHRFEEKLVVARSFAAADVANIFFIAPFRCRVTRISEVHATVAGQAGTMTVERLQATEAPGSGDDLIATTKIDQEGTINTIQSPTLTGTVADLVLEVGVRLALLQSTGSATSLANAVISVELERA